MTEKIIELGDGTQIKEFCLSRMSDSISNFEAIWDILDIITRTTKLNVNKNAEGFITGVSLEFPKVDEVVAQMALRNFETYHSMRINDPDISLEEILKMRREKLEKLIKSRGSQP